MNERDRQAAIYALQQAWQGIEVALSMLAAAEGACQHKNRQDLRGFGASVEHWRCRDCGLEVMVGGGTQTALPGADRPELPD